jgi:hypothetical protein
MNLQGAMSPALLLVAAAAAAVLKAYRLKDTGTLGKQNIYLKLTAGANNTTSEVHNGGVHSTPAWHNRTHSCCLHC